MPHVPAATASNCDTHRIEAQPASAADVPGFPSFLLRVERQGAPDSYVFGTFHSADPRVIGAWAWLRVLLTTAQPRLFVSERDLLNEKPLGLGGSGQAAKSGLKHIAAADPELYRLSVDALGGLGLSKVTVDGLSILQAVALLEQMTAHKPRKGQRPILDRSLQHVSRALGIPLRPLETLATLEARIEADMTGARQRELLWIAACNRDFNARSLEHQTAAFAANDVSALYRATGALSAEAESAQAQMVRSLVECRNQSFWKELESDFEAGGLFVAVGNLHVFHPGGLLDRLSNSGTHGMRYRVSPIFWDTFRFALDSGYLNALIDWVRMWMREHQEIEIANADFDPLRVEFRPEAVLQSAYCPGRRCRVEAAYQPKERRVLLTETVFARLAAAGYPVTSTLDGTLPGEQEQNRAATRGSGSAAYPRSILVRELVRHSFAIDSDRANIGRTEACSHNFALHRASVAQAQFLRERRSPERPHVFPLDPGCVPGNREKNQ